MARKRKAKPSRPTKRPRISKKEAARRARISRALKAYHRARRAERPAAPTLPQQIQRAVLDVFREIVKAVELPKPAPAPKEVSRRDTWRAENREGEQAFGLRDNRGDFGFNVDQFIGKDSVTANITVSRKLDDGRIDTRPVVIEFEGGEDESEFFDNYHEAVRDAIQETWEDFEQEYPDIDQGDSDSYSSFVALVAMAA